MLRSIPDGRQVPSLSLFPIGSYSKPPRPEVSPVDDLIFSFARNLLERVELRCKLNLDQCGSSDRATEKINQNFPEESENSQRDAEVVEYNDPAKWTGN